MQILKKFNLVKEKNKAKMRMKRVKLKKNKKISSKKYLKNKKQIYLKKILLFLSYNLIYYSFFELKLLRMKKRTQNIKGKNFHEHNVNEQNMKLFIGKIFGV